MSEIIVERPTVSMSPAERGPAHPVAATLANLARRIAGGIGRWWRTRQAIHDLSGADAAMLSDLGITHSYVERVVQRGR